MSTAPIKKSSTDYGRSVRQRIMDALETTLANMEDGGEKVWRHVLKGDPDDIPNDRTPFVCIQTGTEEKLSNIGGCITYNLPVFLTIRWQRNTGVDVTDRYLYYLALLQMAVLENHNLGGLTQNVEEDSNADTIIGLEDAYPGGTLTIVITYKTRLHNPYKSPHEPL